MTEGEFPFRSFTMRSEGYDRGEVDTYVDELQGEIVELRRALETATPRADAEGDTRLHDPEGAVTRTLAIAQETADRVLHDAQVEADRRRSDADEHATTVIADADERAARLLGDMEAQAAEVREQGVAAARSAIQVERDKAMAELAHVRRVRDDLRTEAVDLKAALDGYRSQAREASDTLAAAASGPLMSLDLPNFIDDDVVLAGISSAEASSVDEAASDVDDGGHDITDFEAVEEPFIEANDDAADDVADGEAADVAADHETDEGSHLRAVDTMADDEPEVEEPAPVLFDDVDDVADEGESEEPAEEPTDDQAVLADVIAIDGDSAAGDADDEFGGTFLAEVRAAAEDDDVALAPENEESDRFLSELRGLTDEDDADLDSDAADTFFDDERS